MRVRLRCCDGGMEPRTKACWLFYFRRSLCVRVGLRHRSYFSPSSVPPSHHTTIEKLLYAKRRKRGVFTLNLSMYFSIQIAPSLVSILVLDTRVAK